MGFSKETPLAMLAARGVLAETPVARLPYGRWALGALKGDAKSPLFSVSRKIFVTRLPRVTSW